MIFTTYHSLHRIKQDVEPDTVYYDRVNTIQFKRTSLRVSRTGLTSLDVFYFTATPKHHTSQAGMNNSKVYGQVIAEIPAPELIKKGYIVPPQVKTRNYNTGFYESVEEIDKEMILDALDNEE